MLLQYVSAIQFAIVANIIFVVVSVHCYRSLLNFDDLALLRTLEMGKVSIVVQKTRFIFKSQAVVYCQSFGCFCSFSGTTFCMTQVFACHLYTSKHDCNIVKQCHHSSVLVWLLCAVVCSELFPNLLQLAVKKTHFTSEFIHGGGGSVFIAVIVAVKCAGSGNGLEIFCKALGFAGIKRCCREETSAMFTNRQHNRTTDSLCCANA